MRRDPRTREYAARRKAQGLSNKDIIRCLKRFVACEIYQLLRTQCVAIPTPQTP